ncbi:MAG: caspase family protein [Solirubrobacterales bacterium]
MRKALIVGIDYYQHLSSLSGCVNDAYSVKGVLERNADGTVNFAPQVLVGTASGQAVLKQELKEAIRTLFADDAEIALLYFAGHGHVEETGGYLCASDSNAGDDGVALAEVMSVANKSIASNKVIVLDSCHSGIAGDHPLGGYAEIKDGVTILTASTASQYALENPTGSGGVYTGLFVDALGGAAANLVGDITPGSVYAHIDQSLGPWAQRPVFKTNVKTFVSLRRGDPPISLQDLQAMTTIFPTPADALQLDPSFEPERSQEQVDDPLIPSPDPQNTATFQILQNYVRVNLVRPVGAPHMWHAAMQSKSCELTVLGQHYWRLVKEGQI